MSSEKEPLLSHTSPTSRDPFVVNNLNSGYEDQDNQSLKFIAQHTRYRYYAKLHHKEKLIIPDHVLPAYLFIPVLPSAGYKQSSLVTIFAIWNTMMGSSLLSLPWAVSQSGFAVGIFAIVLMGFICFYTCYLVMKGADSMDKSNYAALEFTDVCEHYLGKIGKLTSIIFSLGALYGVTTVYLVLLSNFLYNVGEFIHYEAFSKDNVLNTTFNSTGLSTPEVLCPSRLSPFRANTDLLEPTDSSLFYHLWQEHLTVPFYLLLILFPLSSLKSPTFFTKFNALGTVSVVYIVIFVIVKSASWGPHLAFDSTANHEKTPLFSPKFPALTGTLALAMFMHNAVLSIMRNQEKPENNTRDLTIAYILTVGTYFTIGIVFYSYFPIAKDCIEQVLLDNFPQFDVMTFCARLGLLFQMITVYPLLTYIIRVQTFTLMFKKTYPGFLHVVVLNCVIIGLGITFAVLYPHVGHIIRYVGSFSGLAYIFALPCIVYMLIERKRKSLSWIKIIVHGGLILFGVTNFLSQFFIS